MRKKILESPARKKLHAEKDQLGVSAVETGGPKDGVSVATGSSIDKNSEDRIIAAVIRGVNESSHTNQEDRNLGEVASHTPSQHGSCDGALVGSVSGSVRSRASSVTFGPPVNHRG